MQTSVGIRFDMLRNQCMELRQVAPATEYCISRQLISSRIDRTGERYFHVATWWWVTIIGYIIALATMSTGARYFSLFLMASGLSGVYDVCGMYPWRS